MEGGMKRRNEVGGCGAEVGKQREASEPKASLIQGEREDKKSF